ncbi:probable endochitinase [Wyeomyia smithii]|uniref:probable endochitinase n=1 Tax=Wyeomyia smithii TaxID=174621 RepID=UPI002467B047|nr:probable endochitinase [Wyeomyia smithii]
MKTILVLSALFGAVYSNSLICRNYPDGALIPNPENCAEFFMCRPGRAVRFTCPASTQFNTAIQACDPRMAVRCRPGKIPVDKEYTPITASPSKIEHTNTACIDKPVATLLPNSAECGSFYQCSPTGVIRFECPAGTLFDSNRLYCERSDIASCTYFPEMPMLPIQPIFPPIVPPIVIQPESENQLLKRCTGQRDGTKIRNPFNCRQYIFCISKNRSQIFDCPAGTAFDEDRSACDWERNVKCNRSQE